jgi:hypothetical protein
VIGHGVETTLLFGKIRKVLRTTLIVMFPFTPRFLHVWINMTTAFPFIPRFLHVWINMTTAI